MDLSNLERIPNVNILYINISTLCGHTTGCFFIVSGMMVSNTNASLRGSDELKAIRLEQSESQRLEALACNWSYSPGLNHPLDGWS